MAFISGTGAAPVRKVNGAGIGGAAATLLIALIEYFTKQKIDGPNDGPVAT